MSLEQTLEQRRAKEALEKIRDVESRYQGQEDKRETFASYASNMPASILINGLGQAVATLRAQARGRKEDPHQIIFDAVQDWLCRNDAEAPYPGTNCLLTAISEGNRENYQHAQAEALAYLEWYKKFAVAFLKKPD